MPFSLQAEPPDEELLEELIAAHGARIGLGGLLANRGRRAWRSWTRGAAAAGGFAWGIRDTFDRTWWPQGIDVAEHDGRKVLVVSWYAQPKDGVDMGVRVTFVDLRSPWWPRYHHVLLVEPARDRHGDTRMDPVRVHAGGIGWSGGRILVADTFGGLRVFRLDDLMRVADRPFGYGYVLPQSSRLRTTMTDKSRRMRFSFVSVEHSDENPRLVAGEYGNRGTGDRLVRIALDATGTATPLDLHEPGLYRMQGVCIVAGTWFVTTSNGEWTNGDLWVGQPGDFVRRRHVLPPGPEDLAYDRAANRLWSLSEWPGRRRVFSIDPARWR